MSIVSDTAGAEAADTLKQRRCEVGLEESYRVELNLPNLPKVDIRNL